MQFWRHVSWLCSANRNRENITLKDLASPQWTDGFAHLGFWLLIIEHVIRCIFYTERIKRSVIEKFHMAQQSDTLHRRNEKISKLHEKDVYRDKCETKIELFMGILDSFILLSVLSHLTATMLERHL